MTDEASDFPGLPDDRALSREMYQHALDRKGAVHKCEACGKDRWVISQSQFLLQALSSSGTIVPGQGVEVVSVFCNNCGLIRLHAGTILVQD
ncbi:MAG TPA: hypothetical protein VGI67_13935 [Thermoleophilaceae bacterium]